MSQSTKDDLFEKLYTKLYEIISNGEFTPDPRSGSSAHCYLVPQDDIVGASQLLVLAKDYAI